MAAKNISDETGAIVSKSFLNYSLPYVTPNTLKLNGSDIHTATDGTYSMILAPEEQLLVTFRGSFGLFPDLITVLYTDSHGDYHSCYTNHEGSVSATDITCLTAATESGCGTYRFIVTIADISSQLSEDVLLHGRLNLIILSMNILSFIVYIKTYILIYIYMYI